MSFTTPSFLTDSKYLSTICLSGSLLILKLTISHFLKLSLLNVPDGFRKAIFTLAERRFLCRSTTKLKSSFFNVLITDARSS